MAGIKDKVVVITGASSGIGEATALMLAERGAKVVLGATGPDRLKAVVRRQYLEGCRFPEPLEGVTSGSGGRMAWTNSRANDARRSRLYLKSTSWRAHES